MGNEPPPGPRRSASRWWNIVDDEPAPVAEWLPALAEAIGAKPPRRIPVWLAGAAVSESRSWMGAGCTVVFACDCP